MLIYDQTCAAEKRRRRKKGEYPKATQRVFINEAVCEGCGDCGVQSNCTSILPVETEFGRKRAIDQSSCNQDYSCVQGLLPELRDGRRRHAEEVARGRSKGRRARSSPLPEPPSAAACKDALQHPHHRHRRHRRHHHRRAARHGGASGRQGHLGAGHDRHVAEERRRHLARAHRAPARRHPRSAHRHRRGGSDPRLRHAHRRARTTPSRRRGPAGPSRSSTRYQQPPGPFARIPTGSFRPSRSAR